MKVLHTADIHLGSNAYGRIDPNTGRDRRLGDFEKSFRFMVQRGLEEDIDLFLFCGDAYRSAKPTPTQQQVFADCLKPVADRGIPIVILTGNHDHPVSFGQASAIDIFRHLAGDVHVFRRPETRRIETAGGPLQLIAMPWPVQSVLLFQDDYANKTPGDVSLLLQRAYVEFIAESCRTLDPELPTVLAGHFSVQGHTVAGSERSPVNQEPIFTPEQLSVPPIDYVALGHIHRHQNLARGPDMPPVVYSSSIERISFVEHDQDKGFVLVTIEGVPKKTSFTFVQTPARRFVAIKVNVLGKPDPTAEVLAAIEASDVREAVVRVRYEIEDARRALVDRQPIRRALEGSFRIAAIEPVSRPVERNPRTRVTRETTLKEAMARYIDQRDDLAHMREELIEASLKLESEYEETLNRP